jgi:hypothetical protein
MRISSLLMVCVAFTFSGVVAQEPKKSSPVESGVKAGPTRDELEKDFAERMSNATLVGRFTDRARKEAPLKEEKYTLGKVAKLTGDTWLFNTRIQYGEHDATLPLPLKVVWAGDTPVITLDKVAIPGFGTFTCRVLIFDDQYAGTWDGGNHGGHLFGKIVREGKDEKDVRRPSNAAKETESPSNKK